MSRWSTTKKRATAAQLRALAREQALERCKQGYHSSTPTFRPGETVCTTCGIVFYCPDCLKQAHLTFPTTHAHPLLCSAHQKAQVHA